MKNLLKVAEKVSYKKLSDNYLFSEIRQKTSSFKDADGREILDLSIGDIAYALPPSSVNAMKKAAEEMGDKARKRGYSPENGYPFLLNAIASYYKNLGVKIDTDEILVGDGTKSDISLFPDIFDRSNELIAEPCYPVYKDAALMRGNKLYSVCGNKQNGFLPEPDGIEKKPYVITLCSPNNPTGSAFDKEKLKKWVDFALETGSLILYDAAYSAFSGDGAVKTVFSVKNADECAVEFCSFSKFAGFTGIRCSWFVVPEKIKLSGGKTLLSLVKRKRSATFNGVSYVTQRGAEAALSFKGRKECEILIKKYLSAANKLKDFFSKTNLFFTGGDNCPYLWIECPNTKNSFEFFENLLVKTAVVCTPGVGFGNAGEGYFRLSAFQKEDTVNEVLNRFSSSDIFKDSTSGFLSKN